MARGKPLIRARGRGGGKRNRESDDQEESTDGTATALGAVTDVVHRAPDHTPAAPPAYHYDVRKAIRAVLDDNDFKAVCTAEGNISLTTEALLEPVCSACDTAASEPPTTTPVTAERIALLVTGVVSTLCPSTAVVSQFALMFSRRAAHVVPKREPLCTPVMQPGVPEAPQDTTRPRKEARRGRGRGGVVHPSESTMDDVLPHGGQALLPLPPPIPNDGLLPTPPSFMPHQMFPQHEAVMGWPSNAPTQPRYGERFPGAVDHSAVLPPPALFRTAPPAALPPCSGRVIALDNVPHHFLGPDALRPQIHQISSRLRNCYFFNTSQMHGTQTVIVSVNSPQSATELVARVNYASHVDGGPILAREATGEETHALWSPLLEQLQVQESATLAKLAAYDETSPGKLRSTWHRAQETLLQLDQDLERMSTDGSLTPASKLDLLKAKLAAKQQQDHAVAALASLGEPLEGPEVDACSSSTATACGGSSLIYVCDLPPNIPDKKFLLMFEPLRPLASLVHVWRDPNCPTHLCCALNSAGQVFGVLRALDCNEFKFCGATFSKQRPQRGGISAPVTNVVVETLPVDPPINNEQDEQEQHQEQE